MEKQASARVHIESVCKRPYYSWNVDRRYSLSAKGTYRKTKRVNLEYSKLSFGRK